MDAIRYHEATKHHFHAFARSLGYLDWASQPDPFRRFAGAPALPCAGDAGELLRCSLGLSAWKQYGSSRWALRVNPSSGNLHPTEGYLVTGAGVFHYAPREHRLERRAEWASPPCLGGSGLSEDDFIVGLTSIHWREAWKYGERAFRYCQHDTGHAIGALRLAAALVGRRLALLPRWSHVNVAALLGLDRVGDFADAEPEEPECLAIVTRRDPGPYVAADPAPLVDAAGAARWYGRANRLSAHHVAWPIIDQVAAATRYPGTTTEAEGSKRSEGTERSERYSRSLILQRRSALAFDARSMLPRAAFLSMLRRVVPQGPPWDALWWAPHLHLVLFVHRVDGVVPGIYAYLRDPSDPSGAGGPASATRATLCEAFRHEFLWEPVDGSEGRLWLLLPLDCRRAAERVSCDQAIAGDGFFGLGMLARFAPALREHGDWFYRNLFWEAGLIGQVLYLEAEAAGARSTGIGCYYDDPVHQILGLTDRDWQSLYHFSTGMPVEDARLTSEPGYSWE